MSAVQASTKASDAFRLPDSVHPVHYDITIKTDLQGLTFQGHVATQLDVKKETSTLVFNAARVKIKDVQVFASDSSVKKSSFDFDEKAERITVQVSNVLPVGSKVALHVEYESELTDALKGYYSSSAEWEGKKRYYALTQFEAISARRAFPCWDEPLLKATFCINMISRADTVNLSNMPAKSEGPYSKADAEKERLPTSFSVAEDGWKLTRFEKTPIMSTYLVAWANGHFAHLESSYKSPLSGKTIPLRIYTTPDVIHQAEFALEAVKAKVMPIYEEVFEVPYPLPKLDTLVVNDFDAGAMENWGLITGRASGFLLDSTKTTVSEKQRVTDYEAHECAHLWFGDIVTMVWWDNLWLKEGFATLMGEVVVKHRVFPQWRPNAKYITDHLGPAMALDAKRSSHPVQVPIEDPNEIDQIFDSLSYDKAASVLRMLSAFVGEDVFLKGVSIYLKKHLYGNTVARDLWDGISEAVKQKSSVPVDVANVMDNWTSKTGFPVLRVTENPGGITIRQDRFLETNDVKPDENETIWTVPLSLFSVDKDGKGSINHNAVLDKREAFFELDTSKPFKLNAGTTGVYRVLYSAKRLVKIVEEALKKDSQLTMEDRMGLVADAMILGISGHAKTTAALDLLRALRSEEEYAVWAEISSHLASLSSVWWDQPEKVRNDIDAFYRFLFSPLVEKYGYDANVGDSDDVKQLRTLAISEAASADDEKVVAELLSRFRHFAETGDESKISADLRRTVYRTAVRRGGRKEYEAVKKIYFNPATPHAKIAAMVALCASTDPATIQENFRFALSDDVKGQDVFYFFSALGYQRASRRATADFVMQNYATLHERFEDTSLPSIVESSFGNLTTLEDLKMVEDFFQDKDKSKYTLILAQTLDQIRANAAWIGRDAGDVAQWLETFQKA